MRKLLKALSIAMIVAGQVQKAAEDGEIDEEEALQILTAVVSAMGLNLSIKV
jgi:hypothetical protein